MGKKKLNYAHKLIRSYREDIAEDTSGLLKIASITTEGGAPSPEMNQALDYAKGMAKKFRFKYRNFDGKAGVIECGKGKKTLGILLHLDVVPAGDGWRHPAFSGEIVNGEVWGRGAIDDKGPIVSVLYALKSLKDAGVKLRKRVRVILGTDEEGGEWKNMYNYLSYEGVPDMSFVPDSGFIINGEKGVCNIEIKSSNAGNDRKGAYEIVSLNGGLRPNMVPDAASAVLYANGGATKSYMELRAAAEQYNKTNKGACITVCQPTGNEITISAKGKGAHGSMPQLGHNAIIDIAKYLGSLDTSDGAAKELVRFIDDRIGDELNGKSLGICAHHDFLGDTTVNLGTAYGAKNEAKAVLNIRFPYGISKDELPLKIKEAAEGRNISVTVNGKANDPLYVDPADLLVSCLQKAYTEVIGKPAPLVAIGGTTYAKAVPHAVGYGPLTLGEPLLEHQANERVSIDALVRNAEIYAAAIYELNKI